MRKVIPVVIAMSLTACAAGPNFVEPDAKAPASWGDWHPAESTAAVKNQTTADRGAARWWLQFNDPTLNALEERAAKENLDIQVAMARLAQSRAQRSAVNGARLPTVNGSAVYQRQRQSEVGVNTRLLNILAPPGNRDDIVDALAEPFSVYQAGFDTSWEWDLWGRVRRSVESANASLEGSIAAARDVQLSVMAELARNYLELRGVQRQIEIAEHDVRTSEELLDLTEQRAAGGLVTDLDVTSQRARLADGRARLPLLRQQLQQVGSAIALLLGAQPGALDSELSSAKAVAPVPARAPIGVPSEVARRRPDIRAAEARLHAATADIGVAVADFYPRITLTGTFDLQSLSASDIGDWGARQWVLGPALSLPIFDGGRRRATLELRKAQQQEAAVNYQKTVLQAWHEIDNAISAYANEQRRNEELSTAAEAARAAYDLANTRYRHGLTNFLVTLDSQRTLLQAERDYADSTTAISTRLVALYKAVGGGWCGEEVNNPAATCANL